MNFVKARKNLTSMSGVILRLMPYGKPIDRLFVGVKEILK